MLRIGKLCEAPDMRPSVRSERVQRFFGVKARIGMDADSGLARSVACMAANVHDLTSVDELLHGRETHFHTDSGYQGIDKLEAL